MTAPDGKITTYTYDTNNRLIQIIGDTAQTSASTFTFIYDNINRRTRLTYPNGITATYQYDALSRVTSLIHKKSNNATVTSFAYTYDKTLNKLTAADTAESHQYQYDAIYRLTNANHSTTSDELYTYDPVGNRQTDALARTYTYNNGNELITQNGTSFTYDNNGNITTKTDSTGLTTYQYDYENRLIKAIMSNGTTAEYKYDPFGRRIEKKTTISKKITITKYLYDREDILYEYDKNGAIQTKYIHGPGIDEPLAMIKGTAFYYYHADGLGSITTMTNSRASTYQTYKYDSFGNITASSITQPYTYTGREYDKETGLYFYRGRYYDAKVGRFISKDPIGFGGGDVNLYSYVGGNPINRIDPYGLFEWVNPYTYWHDFFGGTGDLYRNFQDMRTANTIGADKYFHCMGHCKASRQGLGGRDASELIGEGRELFDEYINNPLKGIPKDENVKDCNEDREANRHGREGNPKKPCSEICAPFRPRGLNTKY